MCMNTNFFDIMYMYSKCGHVAHVDRVRSCHPLVPFGLPRPAPKLVKALFN